MEISRRELFKLTGSALLGAGVSNLDRVFERYLQHDNLIDFRVKQIKEYFLWLRANNALEKLQIDKSVVLWEKGQALVVSNSENEVELIIPYRPEVRYLAVVGVKGTTPETSAIRLISLRAEVPNIGYSSQSTGLEFFSTNIFEAEKLSDLPPVEYGFPPETSLQMAVAEIDIKTSVLEGLHFQIVLNNGALAVPIPFVDDEDIFIASNRALASWSNSISRFDLVEIVSKEPYLRLEDIALIASIGLAENEVSRKFNYYLI